MRSLITTEFLWLVNWLFKGVFFKLRWVSTGLIPVLALSDAKLDAVVLLGRCELGF